MNKFEIEVFIREFPFLEQIDGINEYISSRNITIKIRQADENILSMIPEDFFHIGALGRTISRTEIWTRVHLVYAFNQVLFDAVRSSVSKYNGSIVEQTAGESILEAVDEYSVDYSPDTLEYIVVEKRHFEKWKGNVETDKYNITIYKAPRDEKISDYIAAAKSKALIKVRAETDF